MRIEAAIFDFGGVFTTSPLENFAAFEAERGLPPRFLAEVIKRDHHTNAWARFERGEIDLIAFDPLFAAETRAEGHEVAGAELVSLLRLKLKPTMVEALRRVKFAGLKTGCITNNLPGLDSSDMLAEHEKPVVADILRMFDHVIESSKAGVRKPEPRIYMMMSDALGVAPGACVFIDDLGINLKTAKVLGMRTIKVPLGYPAAAVDELGALLGLKLS
ncbi:MAG: HAD-IA family hydrolase [Parvularculaceae bacterium]|nr:HAD-IA family hydrolase [Parvularculaceae bacterium]